MNDLVSPHRAADCASDLQLDKLLAGELTDPEANKLRSHLASCEPCGQRQLELERQASAFLQRFPEPPRVARKPKPPQRRWLAAGGAALAMAAGLALWLALPAREALVRSKGSARLGFYVKRGAAVTRGLDGQSVRPGDQLRFVITTAEPRHVAILGQDSSGQAYVYHPKLGRSAPVGAVRELALPSSVELDDLLGSETIWAVFCDAPFDPDRLKAELGRHQPLTAPEGCTLDTLHLLTEPRP